MATQVDAQEQKSVRVREQVDVLEGENQVIVNLPEAVPAGKVLRLQIEISGEYEDATP
jgi:hypothetical protein